MTASWEGLEGGSFANTLIIKYEHMPLGKQSFDAKKLNFSSGGCILSVNRFILGSPLLPKDRIFSRATLVCSVVAEKKPVCLCLGFPPCTVPS